MKTKNIHQNSCLTREEFLKYLNNSVSLAEKQIIESHISVCAFCKDAMEGFNLIKSQNIANSLEHLDKKYYNKTNNPKKTLRWIQPNKSVIMAISIAASIAAILIIGNIANQPVGVEETTLADYTYDLSTGFDHPQPPIIEQEKIESHLTSAPESRLPEHYKDEKQTIPSTKINLNKRKPLHNNPFINTNKPDLHLHVNKPKTIEKKRLAEANIIIPKEKIRYGYSVLDKIITVQFNLTDKQNDKSTRKILPSFNNQGLDGFVNYINQNINYPKDAFQKNIEGTVIIHFRINENGIVADVQLAKSVHPSLDLEALRVIKSSPIWMPGTVQNEPVPVQLSCPVSFTIQ